MPFLLKQHAMLSLKLLTHQNFVSNQSKRWFIYVKNGKRKKKNKKIIVIPGTRSTHHLEQIYKASENIINKSDIETIEKILPPGWAYGDRYSEQQWIGPERYC